MKLSKEARAILKPLRNRPGGKYGWHIGSDNAIRTRNRATCPLEAAMRVKVGRKLDFLFWTEEEIAHFSGLSVAECNRILRAVDDTEYYYKQLRAEIIELLKRLRDAGIVFRVDDNELIRACDTGDCPGQRLLRLDGRADEGAICTSGELITAYGDLEWEFSVMTPADGWNDSDRPALVAELNMEGAA